MIHAKLLGMLFKKILPLVLDEVIPLIKPLQKYAFKPNDADKRIDKIEKENKKRDILINSLETELKELKDK